MCKYFCILFFFPMIAWGTLSENYRAYKEAFDRFQKSPSVLNVKLFGDTKCSVRSFKEQHALLRAAYKMLQEQGIEDVLKGINTKEFKPLLEGEVIIDGKKERALPYIVNCPNSRDSNSVLSLTANIASEIDGKPIESKGAIIFYFDEHTNEFEFLLSLLHELSVKYDSGMLYNKKGVMVISEVNKTVRVCDSRSVLDYKSEFNRVMNGFRAFLNEFRYLKGAKNKNIFLSESMFYFDSPVTFDCALFVRFPTEENCIKAFNSYVGTLPSMYDSFKQNFLDELKNKYSCRESAKWVFNLDGISSGGPRPDPRGG